MTREEDILDYETCRRLKELGYNEFGDHVWTTDTRHNGESISFEEELDLKMDGCDEELEYVEGGKLLYFTYQNSENLGAVTAVSVHDAIDWLSRYKNIEVETYAECGMLGVKCYSACVKTYTPKPKPECWDEIEPKSEKWDGKNRFIQHNNHIYHEGQNSIIPAIKDFETRNEAAKTAIKYAIFKILK